MQENQITTNTPNQILNESINQVEPTKPNNFLVILLSVFLVFVLAIAGFFAYQTQQLTVELQEIRNEELVAQTSPESNNNLSKDWKTYINEKLKFELKYPTTFVIDKEMNDQYNRSTVFKNNEASFEVMLRPATNIDLDKYYYMDNPTFSKSVLGGKSANKYIYNADNDLCVDNESVPGCPVSYVTYVTQHNQDLYHLTFYGDQELSEIEDQILFTFKFIDQEVAANPTPPVGWKSHVFSGQKLTIYTPADWDSSINNYSDTFSTLIRFWKKASPNIVPIQLDVKRNWDNTGNAQTLVKNYLVGAKIMGSRVDPPTEEEQKMERYQTNVFFEYQGKVIVFECVHNWIPDYLDTCNKMLETMNFTQ